MTKNNHISNQYVIKEINKNVRVIVVALTFLLCVIGSHQSPDWHPLGAFSAE